MILENEKINGKSESKKQEVSRSKNNSKQATSKQPAKSGVVTRALNSMLDERDMKITTGSRKLKSGLGPN